MKKVAFLVILSLAFAIPFGVNAKTPPKENFLQLGDSLGRFIKENPPKYYTAMGGEPSWVEMGQLEFFSYKEKLDGRYPNFMVWNKKVTFGVLQGEAPNAYFLYDTDGDNILDYKTTYFFLPPFIVESNSPNLDPKNQNIKKTLDVFYNTFQSDEGPYASKAFKDALTNDFAPFKKDTNKPNRDLFFLLAQYMMHVKTPDLAIMVAKELRKRYSERYGETHPVILLYMLESYINKKDKDAARGYCQELRKLVPEFIPALVYEADLEIDPIKAEDIRKQLKKEHPEHWIVKTLR